MNSPAYQSTLATAEDLEKHYLQLLEEFYKRAKEIIAELRRLQGGDKETCRMLDDALKQTVKGMVRTKDSKQVTKVTTTLRELKDYCCGRDRSQCREVLGKIDKEKEIAVQKRQADRRPSRSILLRKEPISTSGSPGQTR